MFVVRRLRSVTLYEYDIPAVAAAVAACVESVAGSSNSHAMEGDGDPVMPQALPAAETG